jgi:hypothetical protein
MHWRWRARGRDLDRLLRRRFGSSLPDDDCGLDAVKLMAQHYMRLHRNAESVTRANLRILAPWLKDKVKAAIIKAGRKAKTPTAVQLGRDWRVTVDEVAELELTTINAFIIIQRNDAARQGRRRRQTGAGKKRGRKSMGLSPEEKKARTNAQAAKRMKVMRARSVATDPVRRCSI